MEEQQTLHDPARLSPPRFTPLELATAEQLVHLSESSCSSGAAFTPRGGPAPSSASSSSQRSVNAPHPAPPRDLVVKDDDEQEVGGRSRRNKRYRPISEIYAVTAPIGARRRKDKAAGAREERKK